LLKEELEFIGQKYERDTPEETEAEKQRILGEYDQFQLDKIVWLNNTYSDEITKKPLWSVYNNNIHDYEVAKNKDLKDFKSEEVVSMLNSFIYAMESTMGTIKLFVNKYFEYWIEKGHVSVNPLSGVESMKTLKSSKKLLQTKLYNMDEFYSLLRDMKEVVDSENIKPLLLARYGVLGKEAIYMRRLRYKDIDVENKFINIYDENEQFITLMPIDNKFIEFLLEVDQIVEEESIKQLFQSDTYVINTRDLVNYNTVNSRVFTAFKMLNKKRKEEVADAEKIDRIAFNDLLFTREIELLLQIRKERKLTATDVEAIIKIFNESKINATSIAMMRKRYESLTGDNVIKKQTGKFKAKTVEFKVIDPNSFQTVKDICKSIGFNAVDVE